MEHGEIHSQSDILQGRATKPCIKGPLWRRRLLCSILRLFKNNTICNAILKSIKMRNYLTKLTLG